MLWLTEPPLRIVVTPILLSSSAPDLSTGSSCPPLPLSRPHAPGISET
jgi:hypothetical protein